MLVRSYSEWVIDAEYDWPTKCCHCQVVLEEGGDSQTTWLGCLHIIHTSCLISNIKSYPPHTAPAGYVCPACSTWIWPPKSVKDSGSRLHSLLKEAIIQEFAFFSQPVDHCYAHCSKSEFLTESGVPGTTVNQFSSTNIIAG